MMIDHFRCRPATAVAIAYRQERGRVLCLASEILPGGEEIVRLHAAIVTVPRVLERMGENPAAIESLPPEQVGRNAVGFAPVDLDGEEAVDAAKLQDLRQGA
jgi:hypothetical protein